MSGNKEDTIDWELKYRTMKKKLSELKDLRYDSVRADIDDLKKKVAEHRKIHEISIKELRQQNSQMKLAIEELENMKKDIERKTQTITKYKRDIAGKDSTLKIVLQYPYLRVNGASKGRYQISACENDSMQFELIKDDSYTYRPHSLPNWSSIPDFMLNEICFDISKLNDFCMAVTETISNHQ